MVSLGSDGIGINPARPTRLSRSEANASLILACGSMGSWRFLGPGCFLRRFLFRVCVQPFHLAEYENNLGSGGLVEVRDVPGLVVSYLKPR
jgi:hypothetical protein